MKEIGEELKQLRKKSGVDLEEASHDLNISEIELECIEAGNAKAFKDIYELKDKVRLYAKYLGVDEDKIADEFNDFLFEKTSKISLNDVKKINDILDALCVKFYQTMIFAAHEFFNVNKQILIISPIEKGYRFEFRPMNIIELENLQKGKMTINSQK